MMKRTFRTGITGALLLGAVAGLTVMGSVRPNGTPVPPAANDFTISQNAGDVIISTDPGGNVKIEFDAAGPTGPVAANVSVSRKCVVTVTGAPISLSIVGYEDAPGDAVGTEVERPASAPEKIGLVDNGIGSSDGKNCSTANGLVESGHALAIELAPAKVSAGVKIDWATLDMEGKHGADLEAIMKDGTVTTGTTRNLLGTPTSDNGCDSFACDNHRVIFGTAGQSSDDYTRLIIAPVGGELALEGGGDHPTPSIERSVLHLTAQSSYEYELVCGSNATTIYGENTGTGGLPAGSVKGISEDPTDDDWTVTPAPGGASDYPSKVEIFRYAGPNNKPCPSIGADVSGAPDGVLLTPSDDTAYLRAKLTWVIPAGIVDLASGDVFDRKVDVDGDGPIAPADARYCDDLTGGVPFDATAVGTATHPANTPWCVLSDTRELTTIGGVDVVIQTMVWDGLGDPRWL
jgi:hypothetical protein